MGNLGEHHLPGLRATRPEGVASPSGGVHRESARVQVTRVPDDLVGTILFLAGHGSDFVTGQDICGDLELL